MSWRPAEKGTGSEPPRCLRGTGPHPARCLSLFQRVARPRSRRLSRIIGRWETLLVTRVVEYCVAVGVSAATRAAGMSGPDGERIVGVGQSA